MLLYSMLQALMKQCTYKGRGSVLISSQSHRQNLAYLKTKRVRHGSATCKGIHHMSVFILLT